MRIKDKWIDYFKKPKEKLTVRNQHDIAAFLEDSFTHTSKQLKYKGVWTDYFKSQKPQLRNPITSQHDVEAFLEYSVTHTADEKRYKGVWTDYFKRWRRDEEDPKRNAFNLEAFLEVPYIVRQHFLLDTSALMLDFASSDKYIVVTATDETFSQNSLLLFSYSNGKINFLSEYESSVCLSYVRAFSSHVVASIAEPPYLCALFSIENDLLVLKDTIQDPNGNHGITIEWVNSSQFICATYDESYSSAYVYLVGVSGDTLAILDSVTLFANGISVSNNYVAFALDLPGGVALYKIVSNSFVNCGFAITDVGGGFDVAFNQTGEYLVWVGSDFGGNSKQIVLSRSGDLLTEEAAYNFADGYFYRIELSPVSNQFVAREVSHSKMKLLTLAGKILSYSKTIEIEGDPPANFGANEFIPGSAVWSSDGKYIAVSIAENPSAIRIKEI